MTNRTYRYFKGAPLYPFGSGLSYTSFTYSDSRVATPSITATGEETISVDVTNSGPMAGDEVVQLYLAHEGVGGAPLRALAGFQRVHLLRGQKKTVTFKLQQRDLSTVDQSGVRRVAAGPVHVWIGGGQRDVPSGLPKTSGAETLFTISGDATLPD